MSILKNNFSIIRVIALVAVFIGVSAVAHADVTIPNTFAPDTTISSSQVNANFNTLKSQMPAVKQSVAGPWVAIPSVAGQISTISVTPPGDGYVMVTATGMVSITHTSGSSGVYCLDLHNTAGYVGGCAPAAGSDTAIRSYIPSGFPTTGTSDYGTPYSIVKVFAVTSGTAATFYLNGYATGLDAAVLFQPALTALFIPNALP